MIEVCFLMLDNELCFSVMLELHQNFDLMETLRTGNNCFAENLLREFFYDFIPEGTFTVNFSTGTSFFEYGLCLLV